MIKSLRWLRMIAVLAVLVTGMGYAIVLVAVRTFRAADEVFDSFESLEDALRFDAFYNAEGWEGFALIPLPALAYSSAALAMVLVMELALRSWRRTRIFVSYQHNYQSIATEIQRAVLSSGFRVSMLAFEARAHDQTILEVHKLLRRSQVVVAIPGPQQSWMDGEIHIASIDRKGIVVIDHLYTQRPLPGAFEGYPTFTFDCLKESEFVPLIKFLRLARNTPSTVATNFVAAAGFGITAALYVVSAFAMLGVFAFLVSIPIGLIRGGFETIAQGAVGRLNILGWWLLMGVIVLPLVFIAVAIYRRIYAASVLRQTVLTGRFTAQKLVGFGFEEFVRCMPGGTEALAEADGK